MGKSKGGKYFHAPRRRGPKEEAGDGEGSEEEKWQASRKVGGQSSNVGMLPPSDSEEEEEEEQEKKEKKEQAPKAQEKVPKASGQAPTAGQLPPNSDDDEEDEDEEDDSEEESDDEPINEYLSAPSQKKKDKGRVSEERDPETIRKDLERLELIRKKREDDRLKRIAQEGWDRFAPISDTNRPPGSVPSDHPDHKK